MPPAWACCRVQRGSESTLVPAVMPPSGRFEVEISFYVRRLPGPRLRPFLDHAREHVEEGFVGAAVVPSKEGSRATSRRSTAAIAGPLLRRRDGGRVERGLGVRRPHAVRLPGLARAQLFGDTAEREQLLRKEATFATAVATDRAGYLALLEALASLSATASSRTRRIQSVAVRRSRAAARSIPARRARVMRSVMRASRGVPLGTLAILQRPRRAIKILRCFPEQFSTNRHLLGAN